jgi:hypothetical protein
LYDLIKENVMRSLYYVPELNEYKGDGVYFSLHMFQLDNRWTCSDEISYFRDPYRRVVAPFRL